MDSAIQKFQERVQLLDTLTSETKGNWGVMDAQNMVEHIGGIFFGTAKGTTNMSLVLPPEQAARAKAGFFSRYYSFPKGVKMPGAQDQPATAPPHRYASFEEALQKCKAASDLFVQACQANPTVTSVHGYFGDLTMEEWLAFHIKHVEHHLMQFGILPYDEKIPQLEKFLYKINKGIHADTPTKWGKMNAHQMIEHLGLVFVLSTGKFDLAYKGTEEDAQRYWESFQASNDPWKEVFPPTSFGDPKPPRNPTIEASKAALQKTFRKYLAYCEANPEAINSHFFLGNLSVDQWRQVHVKHLQHHARQFGLEL